MGKPTKRQSRKRFNYDTNRRKMRMKQQKLPAIRCSQIKESWDLKKSAQANLREMGLSADPNKTLRIKKTKEMIGPMEVDEPSSQKKIKLPTKLHVAESLEAEANLPVERTIKMPEDDVLYCTYMLDKYGDDYKAMARDTRNYYQDTPKQIKHKLNHFKNTTTQYEVYLKSKVHNIYHPCRLNCCSPEPRDLQCPPPCDIRLQRRLRRVTRRYEAARRNGHYAVSPAIVDDETTLKTPVSLSRVRRKLNFGRKPPKDRCNNENDNITMETEGLMEYTDPGNKRSRTRSCKCFSGELRHLSDSDCSKVSILVSPCTDKRT